MFCADIKYHWPLNDGCRWSSWVVTKILFFAGDAYIDGVYVVFLSIVNLDVEGISSTLSLWTILDPPLGNTIVYISQIWSSRGMLTMFTGLQDPLYVKYMWIFLIYVWRILLWARMWFMIDDRWRDIEDHFLKIGVQMWLMFGDRWGDHVNKFLRLIFFRAALSKLH